jgi:hypothetical protein
MKVDRVPLAFLLITGMLLVSIQGSSIPAAAGPTPDPGPNAEWHVCPQGPPSCDYTVIQDAVDAAGNGDTIKIAAGTYTGINNYGNLAQVVYIDKRVTLRGGYTAAFIDPPDPAANPTIVDAQGGGRVVYITATISPVVLEGLTITQGDATGLGGGPWSYDGVGGGIYVISTSTTISNCEIVANTGSTTGYGGGGGVYLWWSNSSLMGNEIHANVAGIYAAGLSEGGGIAMSESAAGLIRNAIYDNIANDAGFGIGGGIYMECFLSPDHPVLYDNVVSHNWASGSGGQGLGGGIFAGYDSNPDWMFNNALVGNTSGGTMDSKGAGLYVEYATFTMTHTTIDANAGFDSQGVYVDGGSVHLVNTIVASQAGTAITTTAGSAVTVTGVLWYDNGSNVGGPGTIHVTDAITGNPNLAGDGYHVVSPSLAIDNGVATMVGTDIDGQIRPYGAGPDLGADEWWPTTCIPVSEATISGPTSGYTDTTYAFTASPLPGGASPPFTYTWSPDPTGGQGTATATYRWTGAGTYLLTATVVNCGGAATETHTITITTPPSCPYPLTGVSISGPSEVFVGFPASYAATVQPANATLPITYTWTPLPDRGQGTPAVRYTWTTTGTEIVAIDAENCGGGLVGDSLMVDIRSEITGTSEPTLSLTLVYTDYQGVSTTVEIPAGAVTETTILAFMPVFAPTHPVSPGLAFANHNFDLSAYRNGLLPGFAFAQPISVSIAYSDADVRWIDEGSLRLYYWDGSAWVDAASTCTPPSVYVRDPGQNMLSAAICHLSEWSMMGMPVPRYDIYLPLVVGGN